MNVFIIPDLFRYILTLIGSYHRSKICSVSSYWRDTVVSTSALLSACGQLYTERFDPMIISSHLYSRILSDYHLVVRLKWLPWRALWYACVDSADSIPQCIELLITRMQYTLNSQIKPKFKRQLLKKYNNIARRCIPIMAYDSAYNDCIISLLVDYKSNLVDYTDASIILEYKKNENVPLGKIAYAAAMFHGNMELADRLTVGLSGELFSHIIMGRVDLYWTFAGGSSAAIERISYDQSEQHRDYIIKGALRGGKESSLAYIRKHYWHVELNRDHVYEAARGRHIESLKYIFFEGSNINRNTICRTAWHHVSAVGNLAMLRYLQTVDTTLDEKMLINCMNGTAVIYNNTILIDEYLSDNHSENINILPTLFTQAAYYNSTTLKHLLNKYGSSLQNDEIMRLVLSACGMNNAPSAKLLVNLLSEDDIMKVLSYVKDQQTQFLIRIFGRNRVITSNV